MKRKHRRFLKNLCVWLIFSVLLLAMTANILLSTQSDFQSRIQFLQTMEFSRLNMKTIIPTLPKRNTTLAVQNAGAIKASIQHGSHKQNKLNRSNDIKLLNKWKVPMKSTSHWNSNISKQDNASENVTLLLGSPRLKSGFLTIGLCTVPRMRASYLIETIGTVVEAMGDIEKKETVIVIFLASFDGSWIEKTIGNLNDRFYNEINDGLILGIQPKPQIYPDFQKLVKRNFNDSLERVRWRTKQNIDYAYLFSYCKNLSQFYIHIEDDITAAKNFISDIKKFLFRHEDKTWFCLEFSSLGFIGKLFHTYNLQLISNYLLLFQEEQPCDLLLNYLKRIMMQSRDFRSRKALFQHRGVISSLENKKQWLLEERFKDKVPGQRKNFKKRKIHNPSAVITTNLSQYRAFSPDKAYLHSATDYFWCKSPYRGSYYTLEFEKPVNLSHIYIQTGHPIKGTDKLDEGEIRLGLTGENSKCGKTVTIAKFVRGIVDIDTEKSSFPPNINCLTILVTEDQSEWLIISEIGLT